MATITRTGFGTWRALIRKKGWPSTCKNFRTKRDAQDWSRRIEDEMVRGVYIQRSASEQTTLNDALNRYLKEVTPLKKPTTQTAEKKRAEQLRISLGSYSVAAITPVLVADYRDARLKEGKSVSTVRLELALLGHLFTIAIKEWGLGLPMNPVSLIRRPSPGPVDVRVSAVPSCLISSTTTFLPFIKSMACSIYLELTLNQSLTHREADWLIKYFAFSRIPAIHALKLFWGETTKKNRQAAAKPFVGYGDPLLNGAAPHCQSTKGLETSFAAQDFYNTKSGHADVKKIADLCRLPNTKRELQTLARTLNADPDDSIFVQERNTEQEIKAASQSGKLEQYRVVAFSTHGLLAQQTTGFMDGKAEPGLVFTPPATETDEDDGLLTASEIAVLDLNAD